MPKFEISAAELSQFKTTIQMRRAKMGLTLVQASNLIGCNRSYLSALELYEAKPSLGMLFKIGKVYKISYTKLLGRG